MVTMGLGNCQWIGQAHCVKTQNCHGNSWVQKRSFPRIGCAARRPPANICQEMLSLICHHYDQQALLLLLLLCLLLLLILLLLLLLLLLLINKVTTNTITTVMGTFHQIKSNRTVLNGEPSTGKHSTDMFSVMVMPECTIFKIPIVLFRPFPVTSWLWSSNFWL